MTLLHTKALLHTLFYLRSRWSKLCVCFCISPSYTLDDILAVAIIWSGRNPNFSIVLRRNRCDVSPYIREIQFPALALNQGIEIQNDSWNRAFLEQTAPWRRVYWLSLKNDVLAFMSTMICESWCCERKRCSRMDFLKDSDKCDFLYIIWIVEKVL